MTTYRVCVYREDRWWMIRIPALDDYDHGRWPGEALTQARRYGEIESQARDYICTVTDVAPSTIELDVHVTVGGDDVSALADKIRTAKESAAQLERTAHDQARKLAMDLADAQVPVRDIGTILGVTYQRAAQLAAGSR